MHHAHRFAAVLALLALLFLATTSRAAPRVVVSAAPGQTRPLVLAPREGAYAADLIVSNVGDEPLQIGRIAILGDESDPRAPARTSVRFAEGAGTSATIPPGASKLATVRWAPEKDPRVRQATGHVVVTSNDEASGEVAIGFSARVPTALPAVLDHLASWLLLLPLAAAALALGLRVAGRPLDRAMRSVAIGVGIVEVTLAAVAFARFAPDVSRADGNEGLQLVERAAWVRPIGVEWYLGVDGASIGLLLALQIVLALSTLASFGVERRAGGYYALVLAAWGGANGVVLAQDVVLVFLSWQIVLGAACLLLATFGATSRRYAVAAKVAILALVSGAAMLAAILALRHSSHRAFLVDGSVVAHTSSLPELGRVAFSRATVCGVPLAHAVTVALFVAFAIAGAAFPFHTWLPDALSEAPAPVAAIVAGAILPLAPHSLLRAGLVVAPDGARFVSGALVGFGAATVVWGALSAFAQHDVRRIVAYGSSARVGLCFVGLGALTPQGVAGALAQMPAHALSTALVLLALGMLEERAGRDVRALALAPRSRVVVAIAFFAWAGAPALAGFWGTMLVLAGAFPSWPLSTALALAGATLVAACAAWTVQRACLRPGADDLDARELACVAPLVVAVVLLGVWPVPMLAAASAGARDAVARMNPAGPDPLAEVGRAASALVARVR